MLKGTVFFTACMISVFYLGGCVSSKSERETASFSLSTPSVKGKSGVQARATSLQYIGSRVLVNIEFSNHGGEGLFLQVRGIQQIGFDFGKTVLEVGWEGWSENSDNPPLLGPSALYTHLKPVRLKNGKPVSSRDSHVDVMCELAWIQPKSLKDWRGADKTNVLVPVAGYWKRNGKSFQEELMVPIKIK